MNELTTEQLIAVRSYWLGCIDRKQEAERTRNASNLAWARGQMDGFERAISILTGIDPYDVIDKALKTPTE